MLTLAATLLTALTIHAQAPAAPATRDTFSYSMPLDPQQLDWATRHDYRYDSLLLFNLMEGLIEIGTDGKPLPALALTWQVSNDNLTYTFDLREDVKWSDGVPLKARDFVYGWKRVLEPKTKSGYEFYLYDIANAEAFHTGKIKDFSKVGVQALDDHHLQVTLANPEPHFLSKLYFYITFPQREDVIQKNKGAFHPLKLVTLGPYQIKSWVKGKELALESNPRYYGEKPGIGKVRIVIEPNLDTVDALADQRKLDLIIRPTTSQVVRHTVDAKVPWNLKQYESLNIAYLGFNTQVMPVSNLAFRRAIALALDRSGIAQRMASGSVPADALIPKSLKEYTPTALPVDISEARRSLFLAGYKNPEHLPELKLLYEKPDRTALAEYVRDILAANLGLKIEIVGVSLADLTKKMKQEHFPLFLSSWAADYFGPSTFFDMMLPDSGFNLTGWHSSKYKELVRQAEASTDTAQASALYTAAQHLLFRTDAVLVPIYHQKISVLLTDSVQKLELFPTLPYYYFKHVQMTK